jgi:hypothetical protein
LGDVVGDSLLLQHNVAIFSTLEPKVPLWSKLGITYMSSQTKMFRRALRIYCLKSSIQATYKILFFCHMLKLSSYLLPLYAFRHIKHILGVTMGLIVSWFYNWERRAAQANLHACMIPPFVLTLLASEKGSASDLLFLVILFPLRHYESSSANYVTYSPLGTT